MPDVRRSVFIALTTVIFCTTVYSIVYKTFLDTSDPLLSHLPHPLSTTHYFANKANPLNVYFIKKTWAWTCVVFFFSWYTSPNPIRTAERWTKWAIETLTWLLFTTWFFGPSILDRVIVASGGECVLSLPSNNEMLTVATEYCFSKTSISIESHPDLFAAMSSFAPTLGWRASPRLRKGHDVSGHIFLLTMSTLFLADQLHYSFQATRRSASHNIAVLVNVVAVLVCIFSAYTTSLYFHSPQEKFSGYILGVSGFAVSVLPELIQTLAVPRTHID